MWMDSTLPPVYMMVCYSNTPIVSIRRVQSPSVKFNFKRNMIREATTFLLDVPKPNLPENSFLQTKVLEINLVTFPNVDDAILANGMFTRYDQPRIAQLCEKWSGSCPDEKIVGREPSPQMESVLHNANPD